MAFIYVLGPILSTIVLLPFICKLLTFLKNYLYDKKNNIKKATVIPLKKAQITNLQINQYVVEITVIKPKVIY